MPNVTPETIVGVQKDTDAIRNMYADNLLVDLTNRSKVAFSHMLIMGRLV